MFAPLPDFTPRDSLSLWYTSSRTRFLAPIARDAHQGEAAANSSSGHPSHLHPPGPGLGHGRSRGHGNATERTALARLAADEQYMHRRRLSVQNFGSTWLKPPGVPKTLHQMREEKREQEEHQEALRREQLAQELADAEAAALPEDGMMEDVQLDGAQDLDDEIPDAEDDFGLHDADDEHDEEQDDDEDDDDDDDDEHAGGRPGDDAASRELRQNDLMAARMRMTDDAFREALVRGDPDGGDMYGADEELDEHDHGHMLDEDDFAPDAAGGPMHANLDDDIPEAESGGYEHTDSEAALSSSSSSAGGGGGDDDDNDDGLGGGFAPRAPSFARPSSPTMRGRPSLAAARSSMDLSAMLSHDESSSFVESSPAQGRRARHG